MSWEEQLTDLKVRDEATPGTAYNDVIEGWSLSISYGAGVCGAGWIMSAMLAPPGRGSTLADWNFIGRAAAHVGAPEDALLTPFETTHPNTTHYWTWESSPAFVEQARKMLARRSA